MNRSFRRVSHAGRLVGDLTVYATRSGRWWVPAVILVLVLAAFVVAAAQVVVPTVIYTLF